MFLQDVSVEAFLAVKYFLASLASVAMILSLVFLESLLAVELLLTQLAGKGVFVKNVLTSKVPSSKDQAALVTAKVLDRVVFGTSIVSLEA